MDGLTLKAPLFAPQRSEQEIRLYLKEQDLTRYFEQRAVAAELITSALPDTLIRSEPGAGLRFSGEAVTVPCQMSEAAMAVSN